MMRIVLLMLALGGVSKAAAEPLYLNEGGITRPPLGWVEFCVREVVECESPARVRMAAKMALTAEKWNELRMLNGMVNYAIKPVEDIDHWGVIERWSYPDDGQGDCEDYVLLKRRELIRLGWPRETLRITVVRDRYGRGHAVLTVVTDRGDFILDNETNEVLLWHRTGLTFVKRQSQEDPNVWVSLHEAPTSTVRR